MAKAALASWSRGSVSRLSCGEWGEGGDEEQAQAIGHTGGVPMAGARCWHGYDRLRRHPDMAAWVWRGGDRAWRTAVGP